MCQFLDENTMLETWGGIGFSAHSPHSQGDRQLFKSGSIAIITAVAISFGAGSALAGADTKKKEEVAKPAEKTTKPAVEGMLLPFMSPVRGRKLFASKGCVVCHAINGIGGEDAPALDVNTMQPVMDPFGFAAKMWRGAATMITMQEDELGEQIEFSGEELADIIAFVHSLSEQKKFTKADIPANISKLMGHLGNESEDHEKKEH